MDYDQQLIGIKIIKISLIKNKKDIMTDVLSSIDYPTIQLMDDISTPLTPNKHPLPEDNQSTCCSKCKTCCIFTCLYSPIICGPAICLSCIL